MAFRCPHASPQTDPNLTVGYFDSTARDFNSTIHVFNSAAGYFNFNCTISDASYWWVECPVIGLLSVVGLIANSLALMVWRSSREHRHSLFLLQALAITDNFYLLVALFVMPIRVALPELSNSFEEISPLTNYLVNTAQSLCILMIVLVTAERYLYVCHPFQASQTLRITRKFWLVGLVYSFSFLYNLPYVVCYCVEFEKDINATSFTNYKVLRPGVKWDLLVQVYENGLRFVLMFLLPLLVLAVMSRRLVGDIRTVRRQEAALSVCETEQADLDDHSQNGRRDSFKEAIKEEDGSPPRHSSRDNSDQHVSSSHHRQHHVTSFRFKLYQPKRRSQARDDSGGGKITTLLTIIVFIFMVCQSMEMIYIFISLLSLDYCTIAKVDVIAPISHLLLVVNSSANFFVYFIFGSQFRRRFFQMIKPRHF